MQWGPKQRQSGFTIVELLIVVVVIAILAAITIIAYNGINKRAKDSAIQSTLTSYAKKLSAYRYSAGNSVETYPTNLSDAGLSSPSDMTMSYKPLVASAYYCLDGQSGASQFFITSIDSKVLPGSCPPHDDLVGWWPLDGTAKNMVTGDNEAIVVGVTEVDGQGGRASGAYAFTGNGNTSYIDTRHISSRARFTLSVWAYPTDSSGYRTPLSEARDCCGSGYRGVEIKSSYNSGIGSVAVWAGGSGSAKGVGGLSVLPLGAWTLLTATYDGTTLAYYENGSLVRSTGYSGDPGTPINTLMIGRAGAVPGGGFAGRIDDVRVYTRALTADEVQNLYKIGAL